MIAHVSIPARNPRETALLLAAFIDGEAFSFPVVPGAWIAIARNNSGLSIEVYPETMAHHPGVGDVDPAQPSQGPQTMPWEDQIFPDEAQIRPSAFHVALVSHLSEDQILQLARKAGLRTLKCERGGVFNLIEVWIDNTILIEVLSASEHERYRSFMNPTGCAAMFGKGELPTLAV